MSPKRRCCRGLWNDSSSWERRKIGRLATLVIQAILEYLERDEKKDWWDHSMALSCQYKGCNVPVEAGSEFCIFHSPSPKDLEKFKSALSDQLNKVGLAEDRNRRYLFDGYVFPTAIAVSGSPIDRILLPQTIEGDASFDNAQIEGDASFDGAQIEGDALFTGATIKGDASFRGATIKRHVMFDDATIERHALFDGATIKGNAWFDDATIKGDASFDGVTIVGDVWFAVATIKGDASFNDARIIGDACFDDAKIMGDVWFAAFDCRSLELGFNKPRIRGWGYDRCGILICRADAAVLFWLVAQRIFSRTGEREKADAAFYFERLNHWRVLRQNKADADEPRIERLWKNWIIRPGYWALFLLDLLFVRWTTAYGASIARLFSTWFVVIAGFGITFSTVPRLIERTGAQVWSLRNWIIGFHYSVTTFATLGLGRIGPGPSRLGMVLTSIEAILGAVLIALAVLVIGRRFMRQG